MTPYQIPQELIDILDRQAGKKHSRRGPVVAALAEILTRYDALRLEDGWRIVKPGAYCERYGFTGLEDPWGERAVVEEWRP